MLLNARENKTNNINCPTQTIVHQFALGLVLGLLGFFFGSVGVHVGTAKVFRYQHVGKSRVWGVSRLKAPM